MLAAAYKKALAMIRDNENTLDAIAEYLIEKETITGKQFMEIFHEVRDHA